MDYIINYLIWQPFTLFNNGIIFQWLKTTANGYITLPYSKIPRIVMATSTDTGDNSIIAFATSNYESTRFFVRKAYNGSEFTTTLGVYFVLCG